MGRTHRNFHVCGCGDQATQPEEEKFGLQSIKNSRLPSFNIPHSFFFSTSALQIWLLFLSHRFSNVWILHDTHAWPHTMSSWPLGGNDSVSRRFLVCHSWRRVGSNVLFLPYLRRLPLHIENIEICLKGASREINHWQGILHAKCTVTIATCFYFRLLFSAGSTTVIVGALSFRLLLLDGHGDVTTCDHTTPSWEFPAGWFHRMPIYSVAFAVLILMHWCLGILYFSLSVTLLFIRHLIPLIVARFLDSFLLASLKPRQITMEHMDNWIIYVILKRDAYLRHSPFRGELESASEKK